MSRRSFIRFNFLISLVVTVVIVLLAAAWLVNRYPWPVLHSDFSSAKESNFLANWPLPALDEDKQERKKLRRFPKSEQQRRLGIVMRRMDYLNVPLFDFFLDPGIQYLTPEMTVGSSPSIPLIWPSLPSKRRIGSDDSSFRDVRYMVLPTSSGALCVEGIHMVAGEEIRVNLPPARNKRNITFSVLPLSPSNLRAWLGQFSWARQFNDSEVNRPQTISIPVNDPAASGLRLSLGSGAVLLTSGFIAQWDRSGRLPVQVGSDSLIWRSANEVVETGTEETQEVNAEDLMEYGPPAGNVNAQTQTGVAPVTAPTPADKQQEIPAAATAPESVASSSSSSTTVKPAQPSSSTSSVAAAGSSRSGKQKKEAADNTNQKKGKGKSAPIKEDILDPDTVKFNPVINVSGGKSVALGYNALLIQLDPLLREAMADDALFAALAPRLYEFLNHSVNFPVQIPQVSPVELFQHSIVRQNGELIPVDLPILTKDLISGSGIFNLYREFRNFGYKVVSFATPKALAMPDALARGSEIPRVEGRWLDSNDWKFVARRKELDQLNEPVTGLEAIFKNEQSTSIQSMTENDFLKMSEMLEGLERSSEGIPDWKANEIAIINDRKQYLPRLIDSFQRWMKENSQTRFYAHMYLNNDDQALRPSFKDYFKVVKNKKLKAIAFPSLAEKWSRMVMLDRVFGNIIDTLVARRTYHRTVIGVVIPVQSNDKKNSTGRFLLSVPGLLSRKKTVERKLNFDDIFSSISQIVGVQLNHFDASGRKVFKGEGLEQEFMTGTLASANGQSSNLKSASTETDVQSKDVEPSESEEDNVKDKATQPEAKQVVVAPVSESIVSAGALNLPQVSRFRMIVLPRAAGCQPFEWAAASPYFGLVSSQPIVEEPSPRGKVIRVFPCGLRDQVIELSWFQAHGGTPQTGFTAQNVQQWLGGSFRINSGTKSADAGDAPLFLVGPQALAMDSLPLRLQKFSPQEVPVLFDMSGQRQVGRDTLARMLNLSSQIQSPQLSAKTLVYFFREPIRR